MGASLLEPFMPDTSASILRQLSVEKRTVTEMGQFGLYPNGNKVTSEPEILFARIDTEAMLAEIEKRFPSKPVEDEKADGKRRRRDRHFGLLSRHAGQRYQGHLRDGGHRAESRY